MRRINRCCLKLISALFACMLIDCSFFGYSLAASDVQLNLTEDEWTWIPGEVATFQGTVSITPAAQDEITIQVSISPEPKSDDPGKIVFTSINDRKIKIRKQSDRYMLKSDELKEGTIAFAGSWFIPEDSAYFKAELGLSVINGSGDSLGNVSLHLGANSSDGGNTLKRIPVDIGRVNFVIGISACMIWLFVLIRILMIRRKNRVH